MKEIVFLNGKFVLAEEAKISVLTPGFLYGFGLFETMRVHNKKIVYFAEHLKRLKSSSALIDIRLPYSLIKLKEIVKKTVKICNEKDLYLRLTLSKSKPGTDLILVARKYKPYSLKKYRKGFSTCIYPVRQNADSFFSRLKTTSYIFYQFAYLEAKNKGFEEAIILNHRGNIVEASHSNIFFIKHKELFSPALECGCLDGITRKVVFDLAKRYNFKIYEGRFTLSDLYTADEAFLTNSLIGIMPLVSIEKRLLHKGRVGSLTNFFMKKYDFLLRGR